MKISFNLLKLKEMELDLAIAILGIFAGISFLFESIICGNNHFHYFVVLFFPSLLYVFFGKRATHKIPDLSFSKNFILAWIAIFLILIFLIIWISHTNLYYKPPIYFFLCSFATLPIILHIFGCNTKKIDHLWIILFEIIILSVVVRYSFYYDSAGIYGQDPWWHTQWIKETFEQGHLTPGKYLRNTYYNFPIYHLLNGITSKLSTLSIHDGLFVSTGIIGNCVVPILFVFLIVRKIFGTKIALFSTMIYNLSRYQIEHGISITPMTLGTGLFVIVLYLAFSLHNIKKPFNILLLGFFSIIVVMVHPLTTLITLVTVTMIILVDSFYNNKINKIKKSKILFMIIFITILAIFTIFVWSRKGPHPTSFLESMVIPRLNMIFSHFKSNIIKNTSPHFITYTSYLLLASNLLLLLFFAFFATFYCISKKERDKEKLLMILMLIVLSSAMTISNIFSWPLLPWRWYIYIFIPLSPLGTVGLLKLSAITNKSFIRSSIIAIGIVLVVLFAQIGLSVNKHSPLFYAGYSSRRAAWMDSEIVAAKTLYKMSCGNIITDRYYGNIIPYIINQSNYLEMCSKENNIFIWRNYFPTHPEWNKKYIDAVHLGKRHSHVTLPTCIYDFMKKNDIIMDPVIYSNGDICAFIRVKK